MIEFGGEIRAALGAARAAGVEAVVAYQPAFGCPVCRTLGDARLAPVSVWVYARPGDDDVDSDDLQLVHAGCAPSRLLTAPPDTDSLEVLLDPLPHPVGLTMLQVVVDVAGDRWPVIVNELAYKISVFTVTKPDGQTYLIDRNLDAMRDSRWLALTDPLGYDDLPLLDSWAATVADGQLLSIGETRTGVADSFVLTVAGPTGPPHVSSDDWVALAQALGFVVVVMVPPARLTPPKHELPAEMTPTTVRAFVDRETALSQEYDLDVPLLERATFRRLVADGQALAARMPVRDVAAG